MPPWGRSLLCAAVTLPAPAGLIVAMCGHGGTALTCALIAYTPVELFTLTCAMTGNPPKQVFSIVAQFLGGKVKTDYGRNGGHGRASLSKRNGNSS